MTENPQNTTIKNHRNSRLPQPAPWRFSVYGTALRLFLTCWLIYGLHFATNTVREIYPALSLADHFSFDVSEYLGLHPDIFEVQNGSAFINNNPGASMLGAVPYTLAKPVVDEIVERVETYRKINGIQPAQYETIYPMAREFYREAFTRGLDVKFGLAAGIMQFFLMAPLSALMAVLVFCILAFRTGSLKNGLLISLVFAFATPVFYRTAHLNHNLLAAFFAFGSFVIIWKPLDDPDSSKKPRYFLAGLLAGFTVVLDYSGVVIVLILALYAFLRSRDMTHGDGLWRDLISFALGVMINFVFLWAYQWFAFGNPFLPAQHYMPPTLYSVLGYRGMDLPSLDLLWNNTFGYRYGLFLAAPILLLVLYFPAWFPKDKDAQKSKKLLGSRETFIILLFTMLLLIFTAANQFSRLQFNSGIRHMVPAIPFLFLIAAEVLLLMPSWLAVTVSVIAVVWSWALAMYRDVEQGWGIFESLIDMVTQGPQLPWLMTLKNLGYTPVWLSVWYPLAFAAILIGLMWFFRLPNEKQSCIPNK